MSSVEASVRVLAILDYYLLVIVLVALCYCILD